MCCKLILHIRSIVVVTFYVYMELMFLFSDGLSLIVRRLSLIYDKSVLFKYVRYIMYIQVYKVPPNKINFET